MKFKFRDYTQVSKEDYETKEVPFKVVGNTATLLNVTLQHIARSEDLVPGKRNSKSLLNYFSLPLPIVPNYSAVLAAPNTSGHHLLGIFPLSQPLPSNQLVWVDDLPYPEDSRLVLAMPSKEQLVQHFRPLGIVAKNVPIPQSAHVLHYSFPPLSVPGGFLNPTNAHLVIVYDQSVTEHLLLLGLMPNSHPFTRSLAPSQLVSTEILPLPVGCWSPNDQNSSTDE